MLKMWDVIVVGGGPGGALAAKKCAENGLRTLLLEKKKIPRDKCCSGMVMGVWGQKIVREEFGEYPDEVLNKTTDLFGYAMHVPGAPVRTLDVKTPATSRKTLDTWMCRRAEESGAELWDSSRVTGVTDKDGQCFVTIKKAGQRLELESEFVIGADGSPSTIRKALFPDFKPLYMQGYRECYDVKLDIPEKRFNVFSLYDKDLLFFVHDKEGHMFLEGVAPVGGLKETIAGARQFLIDNHGLDPGIRPLWKDGCVEPVMYRELSRGTFRPARGNVLIAGDAAGLNTPVTGEGLATSLKSGLEAANSVIEAKKSGEKAGGIYLKFIDELLARFHDINSFGRSIRNTASNEDPRGISDILLKSWDYALKMF